MAKVNKRLAVLVGCNYPNTQYELHGCINDVVAMRDVLINRFGFEQMNIKLLTDAPAAAGEGSSSPVILPTGANIKAALRKMVSQAEAGDVLFFHYSGHGTRIPSLKPAHVFRQDEAIVPSDFNLITGMDFRQLVNRVPKGASFTILSDSCHSGGLIDKEKEQIGPSTYRTTSSSLSYKPKTIPFESILHHLSSLTGINSSDIGTHLLESFGSNASLKFLAPQINSDLFEFSKPDEGILLSGCQADETSADMNPMTSTENGGKAYGAFSNAIQMVLKDNFGGLSNKQVVIMARKVLEAQGIDQHPCLYCSDRNVDATFLSPPDDKPSVSEI
ncbi:Metacaspase-9 [Hibiscus syriacus]|uniref:Metacaspase-9 n=1 Tax=Hibiscus syriacus TaxID=106335 RepID=A0A6A3AX57_HIBSY|nr:metacaspase-9-like [Hibiscus syriacus]KAE8709006.1 Metacaspase-9 [Hibiscus syriacus]